MHHHLGCTIIYRSLSYPLGSLHPCYINIYTKIVHYYCPFISEICLFIFMNHYSIFYYDINVLKQLFITCNSKDTLGSKGIRQWSINSCTSPIMIHKITSSLTQLNEQTNQNLIQNPQSFYANE